MLKPIKKKSFFLKFLHEDKFNFIIIPHVNKKIYFEFGNIFHISKFKNLLSLNNLKGNFFILLINSFDIFDIYERFKKKNIPIFAFSFKNFFINFKNLHFVKKGILTYNTILHYNQLFVFINILNLVFCFISDLLYFLKNMLKID